MSPRQILRNSLLSGCLLFAGLVPAAASETLYGFENAPTDRAPQGWLSHEDGLAAWAVQADPMAHGGAQVVTMLHGDSHFWGSGFNTLWRPAPFLNGELSVWFKALSGRGDQGGGIMWRVQDADNYYVARFNPLEDNFRIYTVHNGSRRQFMSARFHMTAGWHEMKIVQDGDRISGFLDGHALLQGTNTTFPGAGGVGIWTKGDAVTSFDDLWISETLLHKSG